MNTKAKLNLGLLIIITLVFALIGAVIFHLIISSERKLMSEIESTVIDEITSNKETSNLFFASQAAALSAQSIYYFDKEGLQTITNTLLSTEDIIGLQFFQTNSEPTLGALDSSLVATDVDFTTVSAVADGRFLVDSQISLSTIYMPVTFNGKVIAGMKMVTSSLQTEQTSVIATETTNALLAKESRRLLLIFASLILLFLLPAVAWAYLFLTNSMVFRPLRYLTGVLDNNKLSQIPEAITQRDDEIGLLGQGLQRMAMRLNERLEQIEHIAYHDTLTGLPNLSSLRTTTEQWIQDFKANNKHFALFVINIKNMKGINQTVGHANGDIVLVHFSGLLKSILMQKNYAISPYIGRNQGDEFQVLLPIETENEAEMFGKHLQRSLTTKITIDSMAVSINAAVIALIYPKHGKDLTTLQRNMDAATAEVKTSKSSDFVMFTEEMEKKRRRENLLTDELKLCIANRSIEMYYQPVVDMKTLEVKGAEALARWIHPTLGFISPEEFIPIAERNNLILPLSYIIIDMVCEQRFNWLHTAAEDFTIAINISPIQLTDPAYYKLILDYTYKHGLSPRQLELEITETAFMESTANVFESLQFLRQEGFMVWLDDFGTGYSSLSHLQNYPVDGIKVDRSFVIDIETKATNLTLVSALIDLGNKLGKSIVAEGIESNLQQVILQRLGAHYAQGYHFDKPLTAKDFEAKYLPSGE